LSVELAVSGSGPDFVDRLAVRARNGDRQAFDQLVERYHGRLFRFAYRVLSDKAEAEDAVQEAFVRAYRALATYRPEGFFTSWIYRITLNECRRRVRQRETSVPLDEAKQEAGASDPMGAVLRGDRDRRLREAIRALPEHYRIVLMLFYFEELSVEEIAKAMSLGVSAVKVRLHRGRNRLAERLTATL
jgi:RNA polymerase sigma-70 factor (ECF subfamily)